MAQLTRKHLVIHQCPTAKRSMPRLTVKNQVDAAVANGIFSESELTRNGFVEDHVPLAVKNNDICESTACVHTNVIDHLKPNLPRGLY